MQKPPKSSSATATGAFRAACYSVAAGVYDIVLALGVEKLKDTCYGGLPNTGGFPNLFNVCINFKKKLNESQWKLLSDPLNNFR